MKLVLNSVIGGTSALLAEALAMGRKGGLGNAEMMDVICQSAAASPLLQYKRNMVVNGAYAPAFTVMQIMKDLDIIGGGLTARSLFDAACRPGPSAIRGGIRE
jgi:3-hydroxyisobutyrate dehydrogenase-like beta-hydroxyacid dehydrogenase